MKMYRVYAVVVALVFTALFEHFYGQQPFEPITEHSEIKGYLKPCTSFRVKWITIRGDEYGRLQPYPDTILIERY